MKQRDDDFLRNAWVIIVTIYSKTSLPRPAIVQLVSRAFCTGGPCGSLPAPGGSQRVAVGSRLRRPDRNPGPAAYQPPSGVVAFCHGLPGALTRDARPPLLLVFCGVSGALAHRSPPALAEVEFPGDRLRPDVGRHPRRCATPSASLATIGGRQGLRQDRFPDRLCLLDARLGLVRHEFLHHARP